MEDDIEDMGTFISAINQINTNYSYDAEGRLVKDKQEEIDTILWTVSGKVKEIRRTFESTKRNLIFEYAKKHCFRETGNEKRQSRSWKELDFQCMLKERLQKILKKQIDDLKKTEDKIIQYQDKDL